MTRIVYRDGRTVTGIRGGPTSVPAGKIRGGPSCTTSGPSWDFPRLEHDLFVIGATFAGVLLVAGAFGAGVAVWVARRLGWHND